MWTSILIEQGLTLISGSYSDWLLYGLPAVVLEHLLDIEFWTYKTSLASFAKELKNNLLIHESSMGPCIYHFKEERDRETVSIVPVVCISYKRGSFTCSGVIVPVICIFIWSSVNVLKWNFCLLFFLVWCYGPVF